MNLKNNQNKFIKKNATAFIGSDGLVGSKIVVIRPGNAAQIIQDTDTIGAFSPADTQDLLNIAKDVGDNTRSLTYDLKLLAQKVRDGEGNGPFHPRLLGAAGEERRPRDESRVESSGREHDEQSDHPRVPDPRQEEQDADGGEQTGVHGRAVAGAVGPFAE